MMSMSQPVWRSSMWTASRRSMIATGMPAAMLLSSLSPAFSSDSTIARLGGEEFGVVVIAPLKEERVAQIRAACNRLAERTIALDGCSFNVTMSAGIAELCDGRSKQAAYTAADKALYLAKTLGRNRVVHEDEGLQRRMRLSQDETNVDGRSSAIH